MTAITAVVIKIMLAVIRSLRIGTESGMLPRRRRTKTNTFDVHKERNQDQQENHQPPTGAQLGGVEEEAMHGAGRRLLDGTDRSARRQSDLANCGPDRPIGESCASQIGCSQQWRSSYPETRVEFSERRSIDGGIGPLYRATKGHAVIAGTENSNDRRRQFGREEI